MAVARRRFVAIVARGAAVLALPVLKLAVPVATCVQAIRGRTCSIPVMRLRADDVRKPGRWGG
ncbi:MAG: hypothetical protein GXX96_20570 [Planctomycetaceae bacterium]|nr:hypothetical protein [Planctomycetaceae bacterium]